MTLPTRQRTAARFIVLDERQRLLLFRYAGDASDDVVRYWATPGGGTEPGESMAQCAQREAREELGVDVDGAALTCLWERETTFVNRGWRIEQHEEYFLVRVGSVREVLAGAGVAAAHDTEGILEVRWWTMADVAASAERIYPEDLAQRLRALFAR